MMEDQFNYYEEECDSGEYGDYCNTAGTVQLFIMNQKGQILLVHHKRGLKKPPCWGLPGGGKPAVSGDDAATEAARKLYELINRVLPIEKISTDEFEGLLRRETKVLDPLVFLTAVKEGVEETGYLVFPSEVLLMDIAADSFHPLEIVKAEIVAGHIKQSSVETDRAGWFDLNKLPDGSRLAERVFPSHIKRIRRIAAKLGIDAEVSTAEYNLDLDLDVDVGEENSEPEI